MAGVIIDVMLVLRAVPLSDPFAGSSDFWWGAGLAAVVEGGYGSRSSMIGSDQATVRSEDLDVDQ
ncbi:hypothetical protein M3148_06045, partial [Georgenia satyanarayanai]|uniref:hypothetical protein n=1 Tax=Georgenia satyanarayanai TaxID=860221 RepID=UPI0020413821